MNIYFAGSIRGGRDDIDIYTSIIEELGKYGEVYSDHNKTYPQSDDGDTDRSLYEHDMEALRGSEIVVAEITQPSLGVGYQIGQAEAMGKRVLCLYRPLPDRSVSAMMIGNTSVVLKAYTNMSDVERILAAYFSNEGSVHE